MYFNIFNSYDYWYIGSNGYAQLSDVNYYEKQKIELEYLENLILSKFDFNELKDIEAFLMPKKENHEFGTYYTLVIQYNRDTLESLKDNDPDRFYEIIDFINEIEKMDLETEDITNAIKQKWHESQKHADMKVNHK